MPKLPLLNLKLVESAATEDSQNLKSGPAILARCPSICLPQCHGHTKHPNLCGKTHAGSGSRLLLDFSCDLRLLLYVQGSTNNYTRVVDPSSLATYD